MIAELEFVLPVVSGCMLVGDMPTTLAELWRLLCLEMQRILAGGGLWSEWRLHCMEQQRTFAGQL